MQKTFRRTWNVVLAFTLAMTALTPAFAQQEPYNPYVAPASDEGENYVQYIGVPDGLRTELFAAEPLLANVVSFYVDHQGRFYATETFRIKKGVLDMRDHPSWKTEDLASRTVEDRLTAMKRNMGDEFAAQSVEHDRIRMIFDDDGDGRADRATVFADGFKDTLAGLGSGVLVDRGDVYYTCIPDLWKLRDLDGDGVADTRDVLSSGYGVHFNFYGHDMHGLRKGPDGRIYFSIGDRGFSTKTQEGETLAYPDMGAILRCNPDGSELEVYHSGLRNPQELAFDNYGNLFTGDNNSDGGDQARWIYAVEGGDSGWRIGYQWINTPYVRGPWNLEKMWQPQHEGQPAHLVPPLMNIGAGPSGVTHYPGTGLPDEYQNHLFMCDFRGDAPRSLVHTFTVEPRGAFFEVVGRRDFANNILATDIDFGMDGGVYISDWVEGWGMTGKARIYRVFDPTLEDDPLIAEMKRILAEGMTERSDGDLGGLLTHADQRVRLEAQYALADRAGSDRYSIAFQILYETAATSRNQLARLHGIWGLGQHLRAGGDVKLLRTLLNDSDDEVRAQTAKVLGDDPNGGSAAELIDVLDDPNARVRFFAATSLGKQKHDSKASDALVELLAENDNRDPYLRHAAVMGLLGQSDEKTLARMSRKRSAAVRLGALLALRRMGSPEVARFLEDEDAFVVEEAVRAINDTPIPEAFPALAALSDGDIADWAPIAVSRRVLNAHLRLTGLENANELARVAASNEATPQLRREALQHLLNWDDPNVFDRVTGEWRPMPAGNPDAVREAVASSANAFDGAPDEVGEILARVAGKYRVEALTPVLLANVADADRGDRVRIQSLQALQEIESDQFSAALARAVESESSALRIEAIQYLASENPSDAVNALREFLDEGSMRVKQYALDALGRVHHADATALLGEWMGRIEEDNIDPALVLDVLDAITASGNDVLAARMSAFNAGLQSGTFAGRFIAAVAGGDPGNGENIFFNHTETSCQRCHVVDGRGGGEQVGPDLTGIGTRVTREYILESIVVSNAQIAEGYENVVLDMKDGTEQRGRVVSETETTIEFEPMESLDPWDPFGDAEVGAHSTVDVVAEGAGPPTKPLITIQKADVAARTRELSSMPDELYRSLSTNQLRDLVEFLATRK